MILLDTALAQREAEGRPIRIGLVGAGFMGRGVALQLCTPLVGLRLVAIANRRVDAAQRVWSEAGQAPAVVARNQRELDSAVAAGRAVVTDDPSLLCFCDQIDALIEVTGQVEAGANTALAAIAGRKHLVMMNAQLDATLGPILKVRADQAGIILSNADGDEPGLLLNLIRHVRSIGYRPVMAGNLKGFLDRYRTADTQRGFADRTGLNPVMCAAYADGTKLNLEACVVANATGMTVARRGMFGLACGHVKDVANHIERHLTAAQLLEHPIVDYALGAEPGSGVFVVGFNDEPAKQQYMQYLKMGDGPNYVFYTPHVLPHLEAPLTAARAVLFGDAAVAPQGAPVCDVVAVAKRQLRAGEILDGMGGFAAYGLIETAVVVQRERLLPMGLSEGCRLVRDLLIDQSITYDDIELPEGRLCDRLRAEQSAHFATPAGKECRIPDTFSTASAVST
jgi:predicted homoserine dehydrogenase-like protein